MDYFHIDATSPDFLALRGLATLYLDATSMPVKIYLYVFTYIANQTGAAR